MRPLDGRGDRLGQTRLTGPWIVLEQKMPFGQEAGESEPHGLGFAEYGDTDVFDHSLERLGEPLGLLGSGGHRWLLWMVIDEAQDWT